MRNKCEKIKKNKSVRKLIQKGKNFVWKKKFPRKNFQREKEIYTFIQ